MAKCSKCPRLLRGEILDRMRLTLDLDCTEELIKMAFVLDVPQKAITLALRRIIEGIRSNNLSDVITFIDFKKVFDTLHRGEMLLILKAYDIADQLTNTMGGMYKKHQGKGYNT